MSTNMLKKYYSQKLADKRRIPKPRVDNYLYKIELKEFAREGR